MNELLFFIKKLKVIETKLLKNWKQEQYSQKIFPRLSSELLKTDPLASHFNLEEMLGFMIKNNKHPDIHHYDLNNTKNIHFTILRNPHFFIELYSWATHTEIHSHNFAGSFQVLNGQFAQSLYSFKKDRQGHGWATGKLLLKTHESLSENQTIAISDGTSFIHQVFHFETPSVSLCIRTPDSHKKYYSYFYPGLRLDHVSFSKPEQLRIKAFSQLCSTHSAFPLTLSRSLLDGLRYASLMYEYFNGLPTFQLSFEVRLKLEFEVEKHIKKNLGFDLLIFRKNHLLYMNKLEMSSQ